MTAMPVVCKPPGWGQLRTAALPVRQPRGRCVFQILVIEEALVVRQSEFAQACQSHLGLSWALFICRRSFADLREIPLCLRFEIEFEVGIKLRLSLVMSEIELRSKTTQTDRQTGCLHTHS